LNRSQQVGFEVHDAPQKVQGRFTAKDSSETRGHFALR
jgi:hypothetical protein